MADRELWVRIRANAAELEQALKQSASTVDSVGRRLQGIGRQLTVGVTAPLAAIAAGSLKASMAAEDAFVDLAKTVDAPVEQLERLRDRFETLSEETIPKTANELTRIAALGGQLGITTGALEEFVETTAALDISTDLGAEDAATGLAQFANVMGTAQTEFDRLGSVIVDLGNNLATTESRILEMGQRIAGAGRQAGLSEDEVLAFAGALSSVGIEAQAGGTAFSKVIADMAKGVAQGGAAVSGFAQVAGMSVQEFSALFRQDASAAVLEFVRGLRSISDQGANVFGILDELGFKERRVADALLRSAGAVDVLEEALDRGSTAWEANTALTEEAEKFYNRAGAELQRFLNELVNTASEMGDSLVPAFKSMLETGRLLVDKVVRPLVEGFANLPTGVQATAIAVVGLVAAAGPLLLVVGQLVQTFASFKALGMAATVGRLGTLFAVGGPLVLGIGAAAAAMALLTERARGLTTETKNTIAEIRAMRDELAGMGREGLQVALAHNAAQVRVVQQDIADLEEQIARFEQSGQFHGMLGPLERDLRGLQAIEAELVAKHQDIVQNFGRFAARDSTGGATAGSGAGFSLGSGGGGGTALPDMSAFFAQARALDMALRTLGGGVLGAIGGDLEFAARGSKAYNEALDSLNRTQRQTLTTLVPMKTRTEELNEVLAAVGPAMERMQARLEALTDHLIQSFGRIFGRLVSGTRSLFASLMSALRALAQHFIQRQIAQGGGSGFLSFATGFLQALPFEKGGPFGRGTLAMVGERGPELVAFDGPGRVFSNRDTAALLSAGVREVHAPFQANIQAIDSESFVEASQQLRGLFMQWWLEMRSELPGR